MDISLVPDSFSIKLPNTSQDLSHCAYYQNIYREKLVYRYQHQITRLAQLPVPSLHVQKASPQLSQIRIPSGMAVTIQSAVHQ